MAPSAAQGGVSARRARRGERVVLGGCSVPSIRGSSWGAWTRALRNRGWGELSARGAGRARMRQLSDERMTAAQQDRNIHRCDLRHSRVSFLLGERFLTGRQVLWDHPGCMSETRSEEHTSELQSLMLISYAVFCLQPKKTTTHKV